MLSRSSIAARSSRHVRTAIFSSFTLVTALLQGGAQGCVRSISTAGEVSNHDDSRPKLPNNAFTRFVREYFGGVDRHRIRKGAVIWRTMGDQEKQPYLDVYRKDLEVYKQRKLEYDHKHPGLREKLRLEKIELKMKELVKEVGTINPQDMPPKGGISAFFQFQHHSKLGPTEAGHCWQAMSAEEKKPFIDAAMTDIARAQQERRKYLAKVDSRVIDILNAPRILEGRPRRYVVATPSGPLRGRPTSSFGRFMKEFRWDGQDPHRGCVVQAAAAKWRAMSDEEKAPYHVGYRRAVEEWSAQRAR